MVTSICHIAGRVPPELGNVSSLHHPWFSHLSSLRYLGLSGVEIKNASHALQSLGMLPVLSELYLAYYSLTSMPRKLSCVNFTSLRVLDLSYSNFNTTLPEWPFEIGSLKNLDLSRNSFNGLVPNSMGNMTSLEILDFSNNGAFERDSLSSAIAKLSNLTTLKLSFIKLEGHLPPRLGDLKNLEYLDLSDNNLSGTLPVNLIGQLIRLVVLDLSYNNLSGTLPVNLIGQLSRLIVLDLSANNLNGALPASLIGQLSRLVVMDLSYNQLNGTLPTNLGLLSRLVELDLSGNSFDGVATETHFRNLINLKRLYLPGNSLIIDIKPEWTPPWQLHELALYNCKVGPAFPAWLRKMENISWIEMSNVGISDRVPDWFWNFSLNISDIDMSLNMIKGRLPASLRPLNHLDHLDMSNNQLEGQIPQLPAELHSLRLSSNSISGSIPRYIGEITSITSLDVSVNKLSLFDLM